MSTLSIMLGLSTFVPPPTYKVIDHTMPDDDDDDELKLVNGSIARRRMNAMRVLQAVNQGHEMVIDIAREAKLSSQTTRDILHDLNKQEMIRVEASHRRGSQKYYFPV